SSTARMPLPLPSVLDDPRAPLRTDVAGPGGKHSPELPLDEARDRGALREAVIPRDGLEHRQVEFGRRVGAYLLVNRHAGSGLLRDHGVYINLIQYNNNILHDTGATVKGGFGRAS